MLSHPSYLHPCYFCFLLLLLPPKVFRLLIVYILTFVHTCPIVYCVLLWPPYLFLKIELAYPLTSLYNFLGFSGVCGKGERRQDGSCKASSRTRWCFFVLYRSHATFSKLHDSYYIVGIDYHQRLVFCSSGSICFVLVNDCVSQVDNERNIGEDAFVWLGSLVPLVTDVVNGRFTFETLTATTGNRLHFPAYDKYIKEIDKWAHLSDV